MAVPQTSVIDNPVVGYAGGAGDAGGDAYTRSYLNADVAFPFGVVVKQDSSADNACSLPAAAGFAPLGVAGFTHAYAFAGNVSLSSTNGVFAGGEVNVVRKGRVWVLTEGTVAAGDACYARFATGSGTQLGAFRANADSGTCQRMHGMVFLTAVTGAGIALVDVNLPAKQTEQVTVVDTQAALSATTTSATTYVVPSGRTFILDAARIYNATGLALNTSNYFALAVKNGSTTMASYSTHDNAIDAGAVDTMTNNATAANLVAKGGDVITFVYTLTGTQTLPKGSVTLEGRLF